MAKWPGYLAKYKPCSHPSLAKEYYRDVSTGDYACDTCGKEFSEQEVWQRREERQRERNAER
jgi:hypothetical protein